MNGVANSYWLVSNNFAMTFTAIPSIHLPPNFGILFTDGRGLKPEVVRDPAFFDRLRREGADRRRGAKYAFSLVGNFYRLDLRPWIFNEVDDISKVLASVKTGIPKFGGVLKRPNDSWSMLWQYWWPLNRRTNISSVQFETLKRQRI